MSYFGQSEARDGLHHIRNYSRDLRLQVTHSFGGDRLQIPEVQAIFAQINELDSAINKLGERVAEVGSNFLEDYLPPASAESAD